MGQSARVLLIPHGQQSIKLSNRTIGLVNVRLSFQGKTAIERDIQIRLTSGASVFLKSANFSVVFGLA